MKKIIIIGAAIAALAAATAANAADRVITGAAIGAGTGLVVAGPRALLLVELLARSSADLTSIITIIIAFISMGTAITIWKMASVTTTPNNPSQTKGRVAIRLAAISLLACWPIYELASSLQILFPDIQDRA